MSPDRFDMKIESPEDIALLVMAVSALNGASATFELKIVPGNASAEQISDLLVALSEVHRAGGGRGLKFESDGDIFTLTAWGDVDDVIEDLIRPPESA